MKRTCSILMAILLLLSTFTAVPVFASAVDLSFNSIGNSFADEVTLKVVKSDGTSFVFTDGTSLSASVNSGETVSLFVKAPTTGFNSYILYSVTDGIVTKLVNNSVTGYSYTVPSSDTVLCAVITYQNNMPVEIDGDAELLTATIDSESVSCSETIFAKNGQTVEFSASNGYAVNGTFYNAITGDPVKSDNTFTLTDYPVTYVPSLKINLSFPNKDGTAETLTPEFGETVQIKSNSDTSFLIISANGKVIDIVPESSDNTYNYTATKEFPSISLSFSTGKIVEISDESELLTFAERVNNGETTLNAILKSNISLTNPVNISNYSGIFYGANNTISKNTSSLFEINNGVIKGLFYNGAASVTSQNKGLVTDCFANSDQESVGRISKRNFGTIRYCGNIASTGSLVGVNNGTISHCYSRSASVITSGSAVENCFYVGEQNENRYGTPCTERDLYKGSVAFELNKYEERFGQVFNSDITPVPLNNTNKIYAVKIFSSNNIEKNIFVNENAENFYLYFTQYDSDRMTGVEDALSNPSYALTAKNVNENGRIYDMTVTVNCSNKDITGFKAMMIHKKTMSALDDVFYVPYYDYEYTYIVLNPQSFSSHLGSWSITSDSFNGYSSSVIQCNNKAEVNNPAIKEVVIPENGFYRFFAYSKSYFTTDSTVGLRHYDIQISNFASVTLGTTQKEEWNWQASSPVPVLSGKYPLKLIDTSGHFARCGMIVATNDPAYTVDESKEGFNKLSSNIYTDREYTGTDSVVTGRPDTEYAAHINGKYFDEEFAPIYRDETLFIPCEKTLIRFGYNVDYNKDNKQLIGTKNGTTISFYKDKAFFSYADRMHTLPLAPIDENGILYIPAEYVITALDGVYKWDEETKTASIYIYFNQPSYFIRPNSFIDFGTWTYLQDEEGALETTCLFGATTNKPKETKPAIAEFYANEEGEYWLWVHARDYANYRPGERYFRVSVNDVTPDKDYGKHGIEGFTWEKAPIKVPIVKGKNTVKLLDTSANFARCDAIFITQSDTLPPSTLEAIEEISYPIINNNDTDFSTFPLYTEELAQPSNTYTIQNNTTKVNFYTVETSEGTVIQNEIYSLAPDGTWVQTNTRDEELGYIVLRSDTATAKLAQDNFNYYVNYVDESGVNRQYQGINPYLAGKSEWYIPTEIQQISSNSVRLTAKGADATLTATWTIETDLSAPLVSLDITPNKSGYYSVGTWEGGKLAYEEFEQALAPYRIKEKQIKTAPSTITEQYLFTPMGCYTLYENNRYSKYPVTKGVVVDGNWLPLQWLQKENSRFGMNMIVSGGGYKATLFYPAMGTKESLFNANQTKNISYRVISSVSDWFENYKFILQDLYNVDDYRENTQTTLNQAIFNTRELMMDDVYSGWDKNSIGHYNIEAYGVVSEANPLQYLQDYLLTDDEELLEERTIPTIAAFLTRSGLHYNPYDYEYGSTNGYQHEYKEPDGIGTPKSGYNTNVTAGMYAMTHGMVPYLYKLGLDKGKTTVNAYGELPAFENTLNMYKYTGDKKYLTQAIAEADNYLKTHVYPIEERPEEWINFIYISYYPNLASLLDIYEATGEQRFLDAAEYTAQQILTGLWVPGIDNNKRTEKITVNDIDNTGFFCHYGNPAGKCTEYSSGGWWAGTKHFRVGRGSTEEEMRDTSSNINIQNRKQEVESWIPSRVGLGLEQSSTYYTYSSNIVMQHWVGDFMRLAHYTGEDTFETAARNAIIGRFSNYSGYYQSDNITFQQYADYPWEGPDYTGIYWHHLPPFLAMLEDFLINQAFNWSDAKINFPAIRQQGYAYFNSNQYGHEPGKFFDEEDMWLWIDDGMVDTGNVQIDWVAARKDGVFNLALMNESNKDIVTNVKLLDKIPGASSYTGTAKLYNPDGTISSVQITNGTMTLDLKGKTLTALSLNLPEVKAPSFSKMKYNTDGTYDLGKTVSEHTKGKAYVLQMTPENYFAYVYVQDKPATAKSATLTYNIGDGDVTVTDDEYPYEFIIKVDNPDTSFVYSVKVTAEDGTETERGTGYLCTLAHSEKLKENNNVSVTDKNVAYSGNHQNFASFALKYTRFTGSGNEFKLTVNKASLPNGFSDESIIGLPVKGTFTSADGTAIKFESYITGIEAASQLLYTISIADTPEARAFLNPSGTSAQFNISVHNRISKTNTYVEYKGNHGMFDAFSLNYTRHGHNENTYRLVTPSSSLPEGFRDKSIVGLPVKGYVNLKGNRYMFESVITDLQDRGDGTYTVCIADTPEFPIGVIPASSDNSYFNLKVVNKIIQTDYTGVTYTGNHGNFTPFALKHSHYGFTDNFFRLVINPSNLPDGFKDTSIIGLTVKGTAKVPGNPEPIVFESVVTHFELRNSTTCILAFSDVPGLRVKDVSTSAVFDLTLHPSVY